MAKDSSFKDSSSTYRRRLSFAACTIRALTISLWLLLVIPVKSSLALVHMCEACSAEAALETLVTTVPSQKYRHPPCTTEVAHRSGWRVPLPVHKGSTTRGTHAACLRGPNGGIQVLHSSIIQPLLSPHQQFRQAQTWPYSQPARHWQLWSRTCACVLLD